MPLARNLGLISDQEQQQLAESTVLVAGVGGVGGRVAETLARVGIGHLIVTDPDDFAVSNLNRQAGCTHDTIGRNKAMVIGHDQLAHMDALAGRDAALHRQAVDMRVTDFIRDHNVTGPDVFGQR